MGVFEDGPTKARQETEIDPLMEIARTLRQLPRQQQELVAEFVRQASRVNDARQAQAVAGGSLREAGSDMPGSVGRYPVPFWGLTEENVEEAFRYHEWNPDQRRAGAIVVEALIAAARAILRNVPASADRSTALRKLREARMDANSAITHDGRF